MRLISHCLTAVIQLSGILSLIDFGNLSAPPSFSALPPVIIHNASPKAISGRTSYLRVRLEFLRYPHLITTFFNTCVFGPPKPFTVPSTWTWIGHPVSGLLIPTLRPIQTWFPFGSVASDHLTSLALVTRRTVLQKVRHQTCVL